MGNDDQDDESARQRVVVGPRAAWFIVALTATAAFEFGCPDRRSGTVTEPAGSATAPPHPGVVDGFDESSAAVPVPGSAVPSGRAGEIKFASVYVDFRKCRNLFALDPQDPEGTDLPKRCNGPGSYVVEEQYSAMTTWHLVSHPRLRDTIQLVPSQGMAWSANPTMEFRLCNGQPFAVIQRIAVCDDRSAEECVRRKPLRGILIAKGLVGFENRHVEVSTTVPKANEVVRHRSDEWAREQACQVGASR